MAKTMEQQAVKAACMAWIQIAVEECGGPKAVAMLCGVTPEAARQWRLGKRMPSFDHSLWLLGACKTPPPTLSEARANTWDKDGAHFDQPGLFDN